MRSQPLPATGQRSAAGLASRDGGYGVLSPRGERWLGLVPFDTDGATAAGFDLVELTFRDGGPPSRSILRVPGLSGYHSLLLSPDGRTLYVIDYYAQALQVVDVSSLSVVKVVGFGRYVTKRPPCAAALSPQGDRLYVLGNSGSTDAGDGILTYETDSWRLVEHYLPGRDFYCLAVSPNGGRLYATAVVLTPAPEDPQLVTIDATTGQEQGTVALNLGDCCVRLVAVVGSGPAPPTAPATPIG